MARTVEEQAEFAIELASKLDDKLTEQGHGPAEVACILVLAARWAEQMNRCGASFSGAATGASGQSIADAEIARIDAARAYFPKIDQMVREAFEANALTVVSGGKA